MRRRTAALLGGGAVAAALALGSLFGGVLTESRPAGATAAGRAPASSSRPHSRASAAGAARRRRSRSSRRSSAPAPATPTVSGRSVSRTSSAGARPATRPSSRSRSARCSARSPPGRTIAAVTLGLGNLALHPTRLPRRARARPARAALAPDASRPYGVVGDALLELGRYDDAFAAFDRMVAVKPTPRLVRARRLRARAHAATAPARSRRCRSRSTRPAGVPEPTAWTHVELAKLELGSGRVDRAARHVARGARDLPGLRPRARAACARRGGPRQARTLLSRSQRARRRAVPLPQFVALLARPPRAAGPQAAEARAAARRRRGDRPAPRRRTASASTSSPRVYRADHGIAPAATVRLARRRAAPIGRGSTATTPSAGRSPATGAAARRSPWLDRSLRLGTQDALLFFHRGYAAGLRGRPCGDARAGSARRSRSNPTFSMRWAPPSRRRADLVGASAA